MTRAALRVARISSQDVLLRVANLLAASDASASAYVYYVALRFFGTVRRGRAAAIRAARRCALPSAVHLTPIAEMGVKGQRPDLNDALALIEAMLEQIAVNAVETPAGAIQLQGSLKYARSMLRGDFEDAYAQWIDLPATTTALRALDSLEFGTNHGMSRRWSEDTTMAVVLPGSLDYDRGEEIERHALVARTNWTVRYTPKPETGARTDIAFLNQDRFLELAKHDLDGEMPIIVTKRSARARAKPLQPHLASHVEFDLLEPDLPTTQQTYLTVPIAMWAMANLRQPATFYFADFYLGQDFYQDGSYDRKRYLESAGDVRRSYFSHDVFFVHVALQKWARQGRIQPAGRFSEILSWQGEEFARQLQRKWGRTAMEQGNDG